MVTTQARWVLTHTNIDPKKVADVWGTDENECWGYIEDTDVELRLAEKERVNYLPALHEEIREWVHTIPDKNNIRIEVIKEQLMDAKINPQKHDVPRLLNEVKILKGTSTTTTPQMIERAKQYPVENLIELRRNVALCPFHNERSPSFSVKNNKYKCFGCGVSGDTISLAMHLKNLTFRQAVEYLQ